MKSRGLWLVVVIGRLTGFLFTCIILLTGVFLLGNVQEFTNDSQILILRLIDVASEVFLLTTVIYVILIIVEAIRLKRLFYGRLILSVVGFLIVAVMFVFSNFLNTWV